MAVADIIGDGASMTPETKKLPKLVENVGLQSMEDQSVEDDRQRLRKRLWSNMMSANIVVFFANLGLMPLLMLQTSLNAKDGLGNAASFLVFSISIPVCFFAKMAVFTYGERTTILVTLAAGSIFITANFFPTAYILLPASFVTGLGFGFGLVAHRSYIGKIGHAYSTLFDAKADRIQARISTIALVLYRSSVLIGNLVSSAVLGINRQSPATNALSSSAGFDCGAQYCNEELRRPLSTSEWNVTLNGTEHVLWDMGRPGDLQLYSFLTFGLVTSLIAMVIMVFFVQSLQLLGISPEKHNKSMTVFQLFMGVVKQHGDISLILLIPLIVSVFVNDFFWSADFTKAFVTCSIGIHQNGYVAVWSSMSSIVCSFFFGWFNTKTVRIASLAVATIVQGATTIALLLYEPDADSFITLCIFASVWYLGSGIRLSLVPALMAVVFIKDIAVAFSNFQLWGGIGGVLVFGLHNVVCLETKLYFLLALNVVAFLLYAIFEIRLRVIKK